MVHLETHVLTTSITIANYDKCFLSLDVNFFPPLLRHWKMNWPMARLAKLNMVCEVRGSRQHNTITVSGHEPVWVD